MDERQQLNAGKAAMITLGLVMLGALGYLVWDYIKHKDVTSTGAVVLLLGAGGMFWLLQRAFGAEAPRSFLGRELPTGPSVEEKKERRTAYLIDSGLFAIAMSALSVVGLAMGDQDQLEELLPKFLVGPLGYVVGGLVAFLICFAIYYAITYFGGEQQSRAVEKRLAKYEDAE